MTQQTIDIEGFPEGWKAVEIRLDPDQYNKYVGDDGCLYWDAKIKLEKIQPRQKLSAQEIAEDYDPSSPNGYD